MGLGLGLGLRLGLGLVSCLAHRRSITSRAERPCLAVAAATWEGVYMGLGLQQGSSARQLC